jgi:hypothetical protein
MKDGCGCNGRRVASSAPTPAAAGASAGAPRRSSACRPVTSSCRSRCHADGRGVLTGLGVGGAAARPGSPDAGQEVRLALQHSVLHAQECPPRLHDHECAAGPDMGPRSSNARSRVSQQLASGRCGLSLSGRQGHLEYCCQAGPGNVGLGPGPARANARQHLGVQQAIEVGRWAGALGQPGVATGVCC